MIHFRSKLHENCQSTSLNHRKSLGTTAYVIYIQFELCRHKDSTFKTDLGGEEFLRHRG